MIKFSDIQRFYAANNWQIMQLFIVAL